MKAQEIVTQCGAAVNEYGVLTLNAADEGGLDLLLKAYEQRVNDLHIDATTCKSPNCGGKLQLISQGWPDLTFSLLASASKECTF